MGADRKGPLAAFIVVAIIAAILLITSVRSQAATAWIGRALPTTPGVVRAVSGRLDQVVEHGAALVGTTGSAPSPAATTHPGTLPAGHHPGRRAVPSSSTPAIPSAPGTVRHGHHRGWTHAGHGHCEHGHSHRHSDHGRHLGRHRAHRGQASGASVAATDSSVPSPTT